MRHRLNTPLTDFLKASNKHVYVLGVRRYLISQHPEAEAKIVAELDAAGLLVTAERPHPRSFAFEDLSALPYLSACIKARVPVVGFFLHYPTVSLCNHCN